MLRPDFLATAFRVMQEKPRVLLQGTLVRNANRVEPHLSKEQWEMTRTIIPK